MGVAVSVAFDRIFGDTSPGPNLGAILPITVSISTVLYLVAATRARGASR